MSNVKRLFNEAFNGHPNIMTPEPIKYGKSGPYYYEISKGEGFNHAPLFGVTLLDSKGQRVDRKNKCLGSLDEATEYVKSLRVKK